MKRLETLQGSRTGHGSTVPRQSMALSVLGTRHQTPAAACCRVHICSICAFVRVMYTSVQRTDGYKCTPAPRRVLPASAPSRHPQVVVRFLLAFSPTSFLCLSDLEVSAHISAALVEHEAQQRLTPSCELFFGSSFTFYYLGGY